MFLMFPVAVVIALIIGLSLDRLQGGDDGVWYGHTEPPEGFTGFWDKGHTVEQWPKPSGNVYEDEITAQDVLLGTITADRITSGSITAHTVNVTEIIPDPDRPGFLTTKQELAQRREEEK